MSSSDLTTHVHPSDVLAAVRYLHGPRSSVVCYHAEGATTTVQGFLSLMLRVKVEVLLENKKQETCSLVIKMKPTRDEHQDMISDVNVSEREIIYFNKILPILKSKVPNLPIVSCYSAHGTTLVMEDLCESRFKTLGKTMKDVADGVIDLARARYVVRNLAKIHVASLGVDWLKLYPELLEKDPLYETGEMFKKMVVSGFKSVTIVMNEIYPNPKKYSKYIEWLLSDQPYQISTQLTKPSSNFLNVLNHGDCWANNMMFKLDPETNKPIDLKFFDLQIFRLAPPTRDLMYFLYTCTRKSFRDEHEKEILRTYVDAFNAIVCDTPDALTYDQLYTEYDSSRMFGLSIGVLMKPFMMLEGLQPKEGEELSQEYFETMSSGDFSGKILENIRKNDQFKDEMIDLVEEMIQVMDNLKVV